MANNPYSSHMSRPAEHTAALSDIELGSRWSAPFDSSSVYTVLDNRGPFWQRTVLWADQHGNQGVTLVTKFTKTFTRIPSELELWQARKAATALESVQRLRRKAS